MYSHLIFDIDGTIIDTEKTGTVSLMQTVKELMGLDMTYDQAYSYFGIPSQKVAPSLGYSDQSHFLELWERKFQELRYLTCPFDGIREVLDSISKSGCNMGCVTSRVQSEIDSDPHLQSLIHYFDIIISAESTIRHKPHPDPILKCISEMSSKLGREVMASDCVYLGDTVYDYRCAHDAGCDFALVDWKKRGGQGIPAEYCFTDPSDILTLCVVA